ncbi:MAG: VWD domain-containing protein [Rhodobacteraceae bacterium]|nr:VWD domain-containing protein [Paracoccaceae bacterium]
MQSIRTLGISLLLAILSLPVFAQERFVPQISGNIVALSDTSVCQRGFGVDGFFANQVGRLADAERGIDYLAVFCAQHVNGASYFYSTRSSIEAALEASQAGCNGISSDRIGNYGEVVEPCAPYGIAIRGGGSTAMLQGFMTGTGVQSSSTTTSGQTTQSAQSAQSTVTTTQTTTVTTTQTTTTLATASQYAWSVISTGVQLDVTADYAAFRLLAYSIHDGTRDANGQGVNYVVADSGETVTIVEGVDAGSSLKLFALDSDTVVIVSNYENMADARYLVADADGVRFESAPTEYSYFTVRTPLESSAAQFGFITFESEAMPGYVLRHRGFRLWLDAINASSSSLERRDSTFLTLMIGASAPDVSMSVSTASGSASVATGSSTMVTTASVQMTAVQRVAQYMESHWGLMAAVDRRACGVETGGGGGFGERRVRTNSHGDVHIFTPDGLTYDFMAGGEFMLVASQDNSVAVQTRQTIHTDDPSVSSNTAVAFMVGETVLEFYADSEGQRFYVDGQSTEFPQATFQIPGGGVIEPDGQGRSGPRYIITWPNNSFSARVNVYQGFLNVGVDGTGGTYSGLIGDLDGNPKNDILPRNGTALICPPAGASDIVRFGDSWRLTTEETLLRAELHEEREILVTEFGTGERLNVETAIYQALETNFTGMSAETSVDVGLVVAVLTSLYEVDENTATEAVTHLFERQGYTEVTQGLTVANITSVVTTYHEQYETRTIETMDIERRAVAQRICEANGVLDPLALATCVMDVGLTQNEIFVESAQGFEQSIDDLPVERRFTGSSTNNLLAVDVILPPARVIELVGPPDVVPSLGRRAIVVPPALTVTQVTGVPTVTLQCMGGAQVPLTGIGIVNNMLSRVEGTGEFPENCYGYDIEVVDGDVQLTTACHTPDGVYASALSLSELPAFAAMLDSPSCVNRSENVTSVQTRVTDITTQVSGNACSGADYPTPAELLADEPLAGGVVIYCATHARGLTYRHEFGRTLEEALTRVAQTCPPAAQANVGRRGEVVIPCREVGRAERDFSFGGGQGGLDRDVQVRVTVPIITITEVPPEVTLTLVPEPGLTASCNTEAPIALEGINAIEGLLSYAEGTQSEFQNSCFDIELFETEEDVVLQATCFNEDGSDAQTSAISLLGVPALLELAQSASCQPEPEPEPEQCTPEDLMGPPLLDDGLYHVFSEDGLEADFPDRGDFVLIRSESAGIEVHARRDLWVADRSESVFTALFMVVGTDTIEVHAAPEPGLLINGEVPEAMAEEGADGLDLPGGGRITPAGPMGFEVSWPETSFSMRVTLYAGSHLVPEIRPDVSLAYQGLVRFTSQWMLEGSASGFSVPLGGDPTCSCGQ